MRVFCIFFCCCISGCGLALRLQVAAHHRAVDSSSTWSWGAFALLRGDLGTHSRNQQRENREHTSTTTELEHERDTEMTSGYLPALAFCSALVGGGAVHAQAFVRDRAPAAETSHTSNELDALLDRAVALARTRDGSSELAERARWSGLLPTVRVVGRVGTALDSAIRGRSDQDLSQTTSQGDSGSLALSLTFRLDRLLFAREEIQTRAAHMHQERWLEERLLGVIAAYCERHRLLLERQQSGETPALLARILELETTLDLYTGGAFASLTRTSSAEHPRP